MERPFVDWVRVENFRCVRQADVHLTRLHALIGPNDAGKSSILSAIATSTTSRLWISSWGFNWSATTGWVEGLYPDHGRGVENLDLGSRHLLDSVVQPRQILRLDPDELRRPTVLIPQGHPMWFHTDKGQGLASLYDALLNRNRDAFIAIDTRFRQLFPTVKALRLENADRSTKTMGLTLQDGTDVGPAAMSEGMLYWLALAIIEHLAPQGILLIEEPENGLHPARIVEVMRVLREVSARTQVIVATHSPLVINELKPHEVTIVTRTLELGTICTPMTETKNFAERSKVYALGELWLSYADGDLEAELVGTVTRSRQSDLIDADGQGVARRRGSVRDRNARRQG